MFDTSLPEPAELSAVADGALIDAVAGYARAAAVCEARRLAAVAELARRRCGDDEDERARWACDTWDSAAAEVAAALNIGHGRALGQLYLAEALRERLPQINALFLAGSIPLKLVVALKFRTMLVDADVLAALDAALAADAVSWGPLSDDKLEKKIDFLIEVHDPDAVRRLRVAARGRDVGFGKRDDVTGTASIWGRLLATDAEALEKRLDAMARSVCKDDPRTIKQRRADAVGALAAGADQLTCLCGGADCAADSADGRASNVVIHIVGDRSVLDTVPDPAMHGEGFTASTPAPDPAAEPEAEPAPQPQPVADVAADEPKPESGPVAEPTPAARPPLLRRPSPGVILGGAIVPAPLLAELIRNGAKIRFVTAPGPDPESHYTPSAKLAEFVRMRDMTCRAPGCTRPADLTDIDHTMPWPYGATHPSDLKCYCRKHHHLKTFWVGDWADQQFPDGTVIVTSPTGKTYTTKPVSALLFSGWNITTAPSPPTGTPPIRAPGSGIMMTKRKRTRRQDHAYRIQAEREHNAADIAASKAQAVKAKALVAQRRTAAAHNELHSWEINSFTTEGDDPPPF